MAIKSYAEMRNIDVTPFCDKRKAKDDKGREIEVPYLNWAKCKELLHQNGAEVCGLYCQYADMLSPTYETSCRDGCWFCHNQGVDQLRLLRRNYCSRYPCHHPGGWCRSSDLYYPHELPHLRRVHHETLS